MNNPDPATYQNFQSPAGLALRMIKRGTYQSIRPLAQAAMTFAAKPLDRIASRWEILDRNRDEDLPQVLVVELPRSGTTIVSQVLAQQLDVSFSPNVSAMFPRTPTWATKLIPVLLSTGRGADVARDMALPVFGGMLVEPITSFVVPTLSCAWREFRINAGFAELPPRVFSPEQAA